MNSAAFDVLIKILNSYRPQVPITIESITIFECTNSHIKNYTQIFVFCFEIMISGESSLNPQGGRLKDRNQGIFLEFLK